MKLSNVVNLVYDREKRDSVNVMFNDGEILTYRFNQLELPYFYSNVDFLNSGILKEDEKKFIVSSEYVEKETLTDNGFVKMPFYKTVVTNPSEVGRLRYKSSYSAEGNIPYLERRLGADGIVNFVSRLENYAYIDIEEQKGKITLIGVITSSSDDYYSFLNLESFLEFAVENKITAIFAWNGDGYDYGRMEKDFYRVNDYNSKLRWNALLKIDAMVIYARYMQKKLMSLNAAGKEEGLGSKMILSGKFDGVGIDELRKYNEVDVRLLKGIIEKTKIHQLMFDISSRSGIIPNVISPTRLADNFFIKLLQPQGKILFDYDRRLLGEIEGATIIETKAGVHINCAGIDINSLYPSVIINNSWKGRDKEVWELIQRFIREFMNMRKEEQNLYAETKDEVHDIAQKGLKVMTNSWWGVIQNKYYRYANSDMANFITAIAREIRKKLQSLVEVYGFTVILSDTDSVYVSDIDEEKAKSLVNIINKNLYPYQVKLEKYFKKMIILTSNSGKSVKKRYVGVTSEGKLKSTGVELIRSDSIPITKEVEETLFNKLLLADSSEEEIFEYLGEIEKRFRDIPILELVKEKVVDSEKEYKSKTTIVKVAEALGYTINISVENFTNKKGVTRERKVYNISSKNGERLFDLSWLLGEKGKPIPIEEGVPVENYASLIDYDFYWNSSIVNPVNRILMSVGMKLLEKRKSPKKRFIKKKEMMEKLLET